MNIKWYGREEGILDMPNGNPPATYLVLTGPAAGASGSRNSTRPLVVSSVFLFRHERLLEAGVRPGTAASVRRDLWEEARIHPSAGKGTALSPGQIDLLTLFAPEGSAP